MSLKITFFIIIGRSRALLFWPHNPSLSGRVCCEMSRSFGLRQGDNWLPASVDVEGHTIPLLNFEQIEQLSARVLYTKARSIRDKLGADRLPPLVPGTISVLMKWLIHVQCHIATQATGMQVTAADFGAPIEYQEEMEEPVRPPQRWGDMHGMINHNSGAKAKLCFA